MNLLPCLTVRQGAFMHRFNDIYSSWSTIRETRVAGIIKSYLRLKSDARFVICSVADGEEDKDAVLKEKKVCN